MIFRRNLSYIIYERYRIGHIFGKNLREQLTEDQVHNLLEETNT